MPDQVTSWTRFCAWATVVVQIGIIATGGIVRVTGSGLGCPTWPSVSYTHLTLPTIYSV